MNIAQFIGKKVKSADETNASGGAVKAYGQPVAESGMAGCITASRSCMNPPFTGQGGIADPPRVFISGKTIV